MTARPDGVAAGGPFDLRRADRPQEREEAEGAGPAGPVVRDKRRLDPETGEVRHPAPTGASAPDPGPAGAGAGRAADGGSPDAADAPEPLTREQELERQVAERTADLQRVQAEYANYRRRVDRDREVVRETSIANVLVNLLPVLDDIGRAREHGELDGGFKSVGEALEQTVERLGLLRFGTAGEPFDPTVHEALTSSSSAEVTEPTAIEVFQPGYRIGSRIVRPARVAVAEPE